MDAAGLKATLNTIGIPSVIPPNIPPDLFVSVIILPVDLSIENESLFSDPLIAEPLNPDPNSSPLTAGMLKIPFDISDSIDSKIGSPNPTGTPCATHAITPPNESPSLLADNIKSLILIAISWSGQRTSLRYLFLESVSNGMSAVSIVISPIDFV